MADIQELEQKIQQLEREILEMKQEEQELLAKSNKALDFALHAYRIDHNGYVWVWDTDQKGYKKTKMRVNTPYVEDGSVTEKKMADDAISPRTIQKDAIENEHLSDESVSTRNLQSKLVTEEKMDDNSISHRAMQKDSVGEDNIQKESITNDKLGLQSVSFDNLMPNVPDMITDGPFSMVDQKYKRITDELYTMIRSLEIGGVALSPQFGYREDIGITQKTLTKVLGRIWEEIGNITGHDYMDFTLTVAPLATYSESSAIIEMTADCTNAISDFDLIQLFVDDELIAEGSDVSVFRHTVTIDSTSVVKAVGTILGKTITKRVTAIKEVPFFMGSGQQYQDVMNQECIKIIDGTLEGDYDLTVKNNK